MSEGIWVYVFLIFCGLWFAVILIGIGVMIGGRMDKRKLCRRDNSSVLPSGDSNGYDSHVGLDSRGESFGQGGRKISEPSNRFCRKDKAYSPNNQEIETVIQYFRIGATSYEKRVLDAVLERVVNE